MGAIPRDIVESTEGYEAYLRAELGPELVVEDLDRKHAAMAEGAFPFLRATYWRWAETVPRLAPNLAEAPAVLGIGDIHLENFGTWRDGDGRLVWGVNDHDEAAEMPYPLDLLRLVTSAILAADDLGRPTGEVAPAILAGYRRGLERPGAAVLDRRQRWLREALPVSEAQREEFWRQLRKKRRAYGRLDPGTRPAIGTRFEAALRLALPTGAEIVRIWPRSAGKGSLGRPRWVAEALWCGDLILREAKAIVPSAWVRSRGGSRAIRILEAATGRHRAPDPWFRVSDGVTVRRLSPNNRKIEADEQADGTGGIGLDLLLRRRMLMGMGRDLAAIHLGTGQSAEPIRRHLDRQAEDWLDRSARRTARAIAAEQREYRAAWKARPSGRAGG